MKYCAWCGKQIDDNDVFCGFCGKRADGSDAPAPQQPPQPAQPTPPTPPAAPQPGAWRQPSQPPQGQWPQPPQAQPPQWQAPPPAGTQHAAPGGGGSKKGLVIGVVAAALVVIVAVGGFVWPGFFKKDKSGGSESISKPGTEQSVKDETPKEPKATLAPKETAAPKETPAPEETAAPKPITTPEPTAEPTPEPYVNAFTDVVPDSWYYDAVMWAGENGIVSGTEFKGGELSTRAQALTFLWRAAGEPAPALKVSPYTDVKEGDWYYQPVLWGFENGLISQASDGQFHAGDPLTKAQGVTFLYRALDGKAASGERRFWDARESDWYFNQANWALEQGLIGRDDTYTFGPNVKLNRSSLITMLYRAFDPDAKKANPTPADKSGFADFGIDTNDVDIFGPKYYNTVSKNGNPLTFSVTVTDYRVFEEADGFPKQDGREYRIMTVDAIRVSETDGSGYVLLTLHNDLYNIKLYKASWLTDENGVQTHTVLYNGKLQDYTIWNRYESISGGLRCTWVASVPKGYDGVIVGFLNRSIDDTVGTSNKYLSDYYTSTADFALFRMYNLE